MKHLVFTLTMPHAASWNGRWSGEGGNYVRGAKFTDAAFKKLPKNLIGEHCYRWSDGWEACVTVEEVTGREKVKRLKKSDGFSSYGWMITSLLRTGEIRKPESKE